MSSFKSAANASEPPALCEPGCDASISARCVSSSRPSLERSIVFAEAVAAPPKPPASSAIHGFAAFGWAEAVAANPERER
jgi:hypothetical protein